MRLKPDKLFFNARRALLRAFRGAGRNRSAPSAAQMAEATEKAYWIIRGYYLINVIIAFDSIRRLWGLANKSADPLPLWPVFWVEATSLQTACTVVALLLMFSAFAAVWRPDLLWPRLLVFLALIQFTALENSFGGINHGMHYPLWVSFFFLFAATGRRPPRGSSISVHMRTLFPIFVTQCFIGLFYSMSGYFKVRNGFVPPADVVSSFHPNALPLLVYRRWQETGVHAMFGQLFTNNSWLAWPAYLAVMYFELFCLVMVFRPQLHRVFGLVLGGFHMGVFLVLGISFPYQSVIAALLFIGSPFAVFDRGSVVSRLKQMPGFTLLLRPIWYVAGTRRVIWGGPGKD